MSITDCTNSCDFTFIGSPVVSITNFGFKPSFKSICKSLVNKAIVTDLVDSESTQITSEVI